MAESGVGFAPHSFVKILPGITRLSQQHASIAQIEVRGGVSLIEMNYLLELFASAGEVGFRQILGAEIVVRRIVVRSDVERLQIVADRVVPLTVCVGFHAFVELFFRLFGEMFLVLRGGNRAGSASLVTA